MKNRLKKLIVPLWAKWYVIYYHWSTLPYFIIFTIINYTLIAFQKFVWWRVNGVKAHLDKTYQGDCYETSAHVLTVAAACKETAFDKVRDNFHFIKLHHSFQHPEIVLADNVILLDIYNGKAIFAELPRTIHHYTVKNVAFLFITLVKEAVRLIEIPLNSFHKLADKVGHPDERYSRITFLFNIGRCGSTVIARMIEESDPETIVLSEPPCLFQFIGYTKFSPPSFTDRVLKSTLYLFLKPIAGKKRILIKPTHFISFTADWIHKILPRAKMFYCLRDPIRIIWGQERAFFLSPTYQLLHMILSSQLYPQAERYFCLWRSPRLEHSINFILKKTPFEVCVAIWADCYLRYLKQAESFYYPSIQYDKLLENPQEFCSEILRLFDLPQTLLPTAMSVLDQDAQDGTILSQDVLRQITVTPFSEELKERTDEFCDSLNLPRLNWEPYQKLTAYHSIKPFKGTVSNDHAIGDKITTAKPSANDHTISDNKSSTSTFSASATTFHTNGISSSNVSHTNDTLNGKVIIANGTTKLINGFYSR